MTWTLAGVPGVARRYGGVEEREGAMQRACAVAVPRGAINWENRMRQMHGLDELCGQGRMDWIEDEKGWVAAPDDVVGALSKDGFDECKREMTTSRRDIRPAGGVWQGVNTRTGSVASAIWVNRPTWPQAIVFITIDGVSLTGSATPSPSRDPYRDDGGEG